MNDDNINKTCPKCDSRNVLSINRRVPTFMNCIDNALNAKDNDTERLLITSKYLFVHTSIDSVELVLE